MKKPKPKSKPHNLTARDKRLLKILPEVMQHEFIAWIRINGRNVRVGNYECERLWVA